jgi:hypothetical protein
MPALILVGPRRLRRGKPAFVDPAGSDLLLPLAGEGRDEGPGIATAALWTVSVFVVSRNRTRRTSGRGSSHALPDRSRITKGSYDAYSGRTWAANSGGTAAAIPE